VNDNQVSQAQCCDKVISGCANNASLSIHAAKWAVDGVVVGVCPVQSRQ
jgi:hypothetical protein